LKSSSKKNNKVNTKDNKIRLDEQIDLTSTVNSSIYGICIADRNGCFIFVNDAAVKMYGYRKPKDLLGKNWKILYDNDEIERTTSEVSKELKTKGYWYGEAIGKRKDGSKFHQEVSLSISKDGNITRIVKDITLRKSIESALKESELKYKTLIDNLHESVFFVDNKGIMLYANKRCSEMFGYSTNELNGMNSFILIYDKDDIHLIKKKNKLREQGISDEYEIRCKKKNGELIWCYVKGTPYFDIKGNIIGSITSVTDITEKKLADEALKESEIKFQMIFMLSVDAIGVSKNGVNILINPAFLNLYKYENYEEIVGKPETILVAPSERQKVSEFTSNRIRGKHAPGSYITKGLKKDGTEFSLEVHVSSYDVEDETFSIAIMRDITGLELAQNALKESEENYRTLVNTSPDAIVVTDTNNNLTLVNQRAVEMFEFNDSSNIIGKSYPDFIPEYEYIVLNKISKDLAKYGFIRNVEIGMLKKNGSVFPADLSASVIKDIDGKPKGFVSIIRDITKRKRDELQLRKYADEQTQLNATKDKFYSIIAHDLRSPFQTLLGYSDMLRNNVGSLNTDKIFGYADNIHKATSETYGLLEDLLQWTGSQTGRISASPEPLYVIELFYSIIKIYSESAKNKNITLYSNVIADLFVNADRHMITTILRNLVSNSIKFTGRNGSIILDAVEEDDNVIISVSDTGIGISEENISKLFRIDSTYSTKGTEKEKGTGLGLIISREFAEKNNGSLFVKSTLGKGSTFFLSLKKIHFAD